MQVASLTSEPAVSLICGVLPVPRQPVPDRREKVLPCGKPAKSTRSESGGRPVDALRLDDRGTDVDLIRARGQGGALLLQGMIDNDHLFLGFFSQDVTRPLTEIKGGQTCGDF